MKEVTHHLCIFRQEEHFSASIDPTMFTVSTLIEYARNTVPLRYFFELASLRRCQAGRPAVPIDCIGSIAGA